MPFCAGFGDSPGVVGADCGIGGRDSNNAAPKEEDGLNGLSPLLKPVFCGCNGLAEEIEMDGAEDVIVAPVGWLDNAEEKRVSENAEPVVVDAVCCGFSDFAVEAKFSPGLLKVNDEATPVITEPVGCEFNCDPKPFVVKPEVGDVCCCCAPGWPFCWLGCDAPIAISNSVGGFGMGGGVDTGTPNGFRDPV